MSSRLFQTVREDRGLAYSIYSTPSFFADAGDLVISAGLESGNLLKTLHLIVAELRRLTETVPGIAELRRAKDFVIGQIDLGMESTESQMNWLGEQLLGYGRLYQPSEIKRRLAAVRPIDIRAVAREFFCPDRLNLTLVTPIQRTDKFVSDLQRILRRTAE